MEDYRFAQRYQKHAAAFILGRKSAQELLECLREQLDIDQVPLALLPATMLEHLQWNVSHHADAQKFSSALLDFHLYTIRRNEKSKLYYEDPHIVDWHQGEIFFLLEMKTGMLQSNAAWFSSDACKLRGIDAEKISGHNMAFWDYLSHFEADDFLRAGEQNAAHKK